ncbi:protease modulator HflC [Sphingomonas sp.]|uniref:protease modulator HflC n=1 Tax=Sphingomonas sp. TaxID=28214 RepID=UPI001DF94585|nr:protease modulator HflC [Sphingomonas sp.]MBX9797134.1 protease modulator HflC [Sphingomonas sp.]
MPPFFRSAMGAGIAALLLLIVLASSFTIVPETSQAVILRFEQPVRTVNVWRQGQPLGASDAGLIAKVPFFDRVVLIDKRVLSVDLSSQPLLSTDQLPLEVDAFARFRIVNPLKAVVSTGSTGATETLVGERLQPLLGTALRNELGKQPSSALLSPERGRVMLNIRTALQRRASDYGVQIVDVRIRHADLPEGTPLESALARMASARQQQAAAIRAEGEKQAQIIRAQADANASRIYADSFNKDPGFYDFYRAMQSYRVTFSQGQGETQVILSPNDAYLKQFSGRGAARP